MRGALLVVLVCAAAAHGFDSRCYRPDGSECAFGPDSARSPNRWIGASDEHRQLWEIAAERAGLPASVTETVTLPVYTDDAPTKVPSLVPVNFFDTRLTQSRSFSPDEFAELPDHGYALWDWAMGFETCPLEGALPAPVSAVECHEFKTHMGPVNSNHFGSQARTYYAHYHALALGRAAVCQKMQERIQNAGGDPARFTEFLRACETEALALEAIGQHFLEDAWSSGHMWERWGSSDLAAFPSLTHALLIAMTSGLIHGARAVLQGTADWVLTDVNDAMCAPHPEVTFRDDSTSTPQPGIGDLYLADLLAGGGAAFSTTYRQLFSCAASGIRAVYAAAGQQHGDMNPLDPTLNTVNPNSPACFGARATNRALAQGLGIDFKDIPSGVQLRLPIDPATATLLVPTLGTFAGAALNPVIVAQYALDMVDVSAMTILAAGLAPDDTTMADGGLPDLLGMQRNQNYAALAPYADPELPWPAAGSDPAAERATAIARTFHRAHALEWCNLFRPNEPTFLDVDALRSKVETLHQIQADAAQIKAACDVCREFTRRHLRVGTDSGDYDPTREPLCFYIADDPATAQVVYQDATAGGALSDLADQRCGCASTTTTTVTTTSSTSTSTTTTTLPLAPVARITISTRVGVPIDFVTASASSGCHMNASNVPLGTGHVSNVGWSGNAPPICVGVSYGFPEGPLVVAFDVSCPDGRIGNGVCTFDVGENCSGISPAHCECGACEITRHVLP